MHRRTHKSQGVGREYEGPGAWWQAAGGHAWRSRDTQPPGHMTPRTPATCDRSPIVNGFFAALSWLASDYLLAIRLVVVLLWELLS